MNEKDQRVKHVKKITNGSKHKQYFHYIFIDNLIKLKMITIYVINLNKLLVILIKG